MFLLYRFVILYFKRKVIGPNTGLRKDPKFLVALDLRRRWLNIDLYDFSSLLQPFLDYLGTKLLLETAPTKPVPSNIFEYFYKTKTQKTLFIDQQGIFLNLFIACDIVYSKKIDNNFAVLCKHLSKFHHDTKV